VIEDGVAEVGWKLTVTEQVAAGLRLALVQVPFTERLGSPLTNAVATLNGAPPVLVSVTTWDTLVFTGTAVNATDWGDNVTAGSSAALIVSFRVAVDPE
jgi:hypothetical protein